MSKTHVRITYPAAGRSLLLRGSAPLSWSESLVPVRVDGEVHHFFLDAEPGVLIEFKALLDDFWSCGRNHTVLSGETMEIEPYFGKPHGRLEDEIYSLQSPQLGWPIRYRVFLPPSYGELDRKRYPVLYAQDGQALFTPDPIDGKSWEMDDALNELYELDVIEEIIVVAILTDHRRLEMLSPSSDPRHGGGDGPKYRDFLIDGLKPVIDARYRTLPTREDTALIGASMGGLFSFFSAWTRPDVFGKAACLSGSYWWNDRQMIHEVQKGSCPLPRPWLYLDSGAARSPFEEDANLRDGFHHTAALRNALVEHCYIPGSSLHMLAFAGMSHNNASWAARLGIPLQFLFPRGG